MKKTLIVLCVMLFSVFQMKAQSGFGIKGGLSYNSMSDIEFADWKGSLNRKTGFHAGILYKIKLPAGLALQPELLYIQKGSTLKADFAEADFKMHYVQLPVNLQCDKMHHFHNQCCFLNGNIAGWIKRLNELAEMLHSEIRFKETDLRVNE